LSLATVPGQQVKGRRISQLPAVKHLPLAYAPSPTTQESRGDHPSQSICGKNRARWCYRSRL